MLLDTHADQKEKTGLAIVIVNYRTPQLVIACLESFYSELRDDWVVVVVDNASGNGSADHVRSWISANDNRGLVSLVESPRNDGFAAGNNFGICNVEAQYYLLLNSDTLLRPAAIDELLKTAQRFPKAGLISPRLESLDGASEVSCFRDHTPISELIDAAQTGPITKLLKKFEVPLTADSNLMEPNWTSFACVLLRRRMLEDVGLLDEGFFMYYEDAELCHRARRTGWTVIHNPAARVVHLRGGSSSFDGLSERKERLPHYYYASRSHYFFTLYGRTGLVLANLLWLLGRSVSKAREILGVKPRQVPDRQWLDIWINSLASSSTPKPRQIRHQHDSISRYISRVNSRI